MNPSRARRAAARVCAGSVLAALCTPVPATAAEDKFYAAQFATCASYFFLNAHDSRVSDYDKLYESGERAYNRAVQLSDGKTAKATFDKASTEMMDLMQRDWSNFGPIETKFGRECRDLLRSDLARPDPPVD